MALLIGAHEHSWIAEGTVKTTMWVQIFGIFSNKERTILLLPKCWRMSYRGKRLCTPQGGVLARNTFNCSVSAPESRLSPLLMKWNASQLNHSTVLHSLLACLLLLTEFLGRYHTWCLLAYSVLSSSVPTTHRSSLWQAQTSSEMCWPQALSDWGLLQCLYFIDWKTWNSQNRNEQVKALIGK